MADKTVAVTTSIAPSQGLISTAGSINEDTMTVVFDEATPQSSINAMLEKAKIIIGDYYLKK